MRYEAWGKEDLSVLSFEIDLRWMSALFCTVVSMVWYYRVPIPLTTSKLSIYLVLSFSLETWNAYRKS